MWCTVVLESLQQDSWLDQPSFCHVKETWLGFVLFLWHPQPDVGFVLFLAFLYLWYNSSENHPSMCQTQRWFLNNLVCPAYMQSTHTSKQEHYFHTLATGLVLSEQRISPFACTNSHHESSERDFERSNGTGQQSGHRHIYMTCSLAFWWTVKYLLNQGCDGI